MTVTGRIKQRAVCTVRSISLLFARETIAPETRRQLYLATLAELGESVAPVSDENREHAHQMLELKQSDRNLLAKEVWNGRHLRYLQQAAPWVGFALLPPIGLFIFGLIIGWAARGFRTESGPCRGSILLESRPAWSYLEKASR
jgi:hypothetical protein